MSVSSLAHSTHPPKRSFARLTIKPSIFLLMNHFYYYFFPFAVCCFHERYLFQLFFYFLSMNEKCETSEEQDSTKHHSGAGGKKSSLYTQIRTLVVSAAIRHLWGAFYVNLWEFIRIHAESSKSCKTKELERLSETLALISWSLFVVESFLWLLHCCFGTVFVGFVLERIQRVFNRKLQVFICCF